MEVDVKLPTPESNDTSASSPPGRAHQALQHVRTVCNESPRVFNLKVLLVVFACISAGLLVGALVSDVQISTHHGHATRFDRLSVDVSVPDARIGSSSITVSRYGTSQMYKYSELLVLGEKYKTETIDDRSVEGFLSANLTSVLGFNFPITTIEYAAWAGTYSVTCQVIGIALTGLAIVLQLLFQTTPDSFILKPGISSRFSLSRFEMIKQGLPGFCLMISSVVLSMGVVAASSFIHNMVYRLVVFSVIETASGGAQINAWRMSMAKDIVDSKQERLRFMQFVGGYLNEPKSVSFGFSFYAVLMAIAINLSVLFILYYNDNRIARSKSLSNSIDSSLEIQWQTLPAHCKVRPLWISAIVLILGLGVTAVGGNVARRRGVKMNRHPYEVAGVPQSFIDDVVISHTNDYFFSTAGIVDGAVMIFMPLLVMIAISSLDRIRFASKCLELLGVIFFMRGIAVMATIMPTLFNVLQHPQCWNRPGSKLLDMLMEKEFCNDLMFSGHTVFAMLPAMIFAFSIIYGPYSYKPFIVGSVLLTASALTSLIVAGRLHYTSDVIVAIIITALLVVMNAPVWKLQFSFRKAQSGIGNVSAIDKVPSFLEQCAERLNSYTLAVREEVQVVANPSEDKNPESWNKLEEMYHSLGELIDEARVNAKSIETEDNGNDDQIYNEVVVIDNEHEPLINKV
jgi:hypothetical protein